MRTKISQFALFAFLLLLPVSVLAKEVSLFDSTGNAVAYIDTDDESTIYLWKGRPVAYLDGASVFGFNGKHLGWFKNGIIRDRGGYVTGFVEGALNQMTNLETIKGIQQLAPIKSIEEIEPIEPIQQQQWAPTPLELFLSAGR